MAFKITGHKAGLEGASFGPRHTLRPTRFASPANGLSRVLPASLSSIRKSDDIDGFGMIVSTKEEAAPSADSVERDLYGLA